MELLKEKTSSETDKTAKYVIFRLDEESFGVNILNVQEIYLMSEITITRFPKSPYFLKGVLNLRGKIVPVINFRVRLGLEEQEYNQSTRVVMAKLRGNIYGLIVDSISSVVELKTEMIEPSPSLVEGINAEYIEGISKQKENLLTILDVEKIIFPS